MTEQANATIIRREYDYNGQKWLGVLANGLLVSTDNISDFRITPDTRMIINPPVENAASAPVKVYYDPTLSCPLKCPWCLSGVPDLKADHYRIPSLKAVEIEAINRKIIDAGVLQTKVGGGEPFTFKGTWLIFEQLGEAGIALSTSTSGVTLANEQQLTARNIKLLARYGVKVSLSVHGEPDYHDELTGATGLLINALGVGINRLIDGGVAKQKIEFRSTISNMPESIAQIDYLDKLSQACKTRTRIRIARPYGSAENSQTAVIHPSEQIANLLKRIKKLSNENPFLNIDGFLRYDSKPEVFHGLDCGAGTRSAFINAEGTFRPCGAISATFPGYHDLLQGESLLGTWQSGQAFRSVRQYFRHENASSPCAKCSNVDACQGGCPSVRLAVGAAKFPLCPKEVLNAT